MVYMYVWCLSIHTNRCESWRLAIQILLESLHFLSGSIAHLCALINVQNWDIQRRHTLAITRGLSASLLDEEREGSDFECQAKLCLGCWGCHVREDTLFLDDDLKDVRDHSSSVSESILFSDPVGHQLLVLRVVEDGAQVSRRKHLAITNGRRLLDQYEFAVVLNEENISNGEEVARSSTVKRQNRQNHTYKKMNEYCLPEAQTQSTPPSP